MRILFSFAAFIAVASAAPFAPCNQNITITTPQWLMPSTLVAANSYCTYTFFFPSDSYAILSLSVTNASGTDTVVAYNQFMDSYAMNPIYDGPNLNLMTNWPTFFMLTYSTLTKTAMKMQMTITLKKLTPKANIVGNITTATNAPSSLIYFSSFKPGASYQITSKGSKVKFELPIAFKTNSLDEISLLSGVFVYDGDMCVGTLQSKMAQGYTSYSQSKTITLYAVNNVSLRSAVFITDDSNTASLANHNVYYAPVFLSDHTEFAAIEGIQQPQQEGAITIVADEEGKSSLTVRATNNFGQGGIFSYLYGGPQATHNTNPLTGNSLPRTLTKSQMWTFYISQGIGNMKFTINM